MSFMSEDMLEKVRIHQESNQQFYNRLAKDAYIEYAKVTDYKNFRGKPMPLFEDLPATIKAAWLAASKYSYDLGHRDAFK